MKTPREIAESIVGKCSCDQAWSGRGRKDPECSHCEFAETISAAIEKDRRTLSIEHVGAKIKDDQDRLDRQGLVLAHKETKYPDGVVMNEWLIAPPKGHVLTHDGVVRKVLGKLRTTADGCAISEDWDGAALYLPRPGGGHVDIDFKFIVRHHWGEIERYFSTPDAAQAAEAAKNAANKELIEDGHGSHRVKCGPDCSLHVVRPGKFQCNLDGTNCPNKEAP